MKKSNNTLIANKLNPHLRKILIVIAVCLTWVTLQAQTQAKLPNYKDEILKLGNFDLLPQYQDDVIVKQISSYDTTGANDDGFSGKYSYLRKENSNLIIADLKGGGVIERIWTPTPTNDTIQFYFDGESSPRIEIKFSELFSGTKYPFVKPIVGNELGGYFCYLPIPYKNSCKIVFKGELMQFFQIQYKEFRNGKTISSFPVKFSIEESDALVSVANVWKTRMESSYATLPVTSGNVKTSVSKVVLKPGDILPVFSRTGGGHIVGVEVSPQLQQLNTEFKDLIIRVRWDNEPVPAINSPVSDFFGYAYGKPSMQSMLAGVKNGVHYCYLPMPFDKSATIELEFIKSPLNVSSEIPVDVKVYYNETKRTTNEGKLYAEWKREKNPENGKPYLILNKKGRGHYVGTLLQAQGLESGITGFFEGDDICTVDGTMRLHGTGSEDYFNGGWYAVPDRWDRALNMPLHGCLAYSIALSRTGGFRFYMTDKISFERDIQLTIEHGSGDDPKDNNQYPVDYSSVAFYYCDQPPVSNNLPPIGPLEKINSPKMQEYWLQLLPIKGMDRGATITYGECTDEISGNSNEALIIKGGANKFAKFELEVPSSGEYKLYMSYYKGPLCGYFIINQRQIQISGLLNGYAADNTLVEKEFIGNLFIREGTNTLSIVLKDGPQKSSDNMFLLHRLFLEKI